MRGTPLLTGMVGSVLLVSSAVAQPNVSFILQSAGLTAGSEPIAIANGDLDGDGKIDLVVANWGSDDVSVFWGNGDGTFTPADSTLAVGTGLDEAPVAIAIADMNGDHNLDLITANEVGSVSVLLGHGHARTFDAAQETQTGPLTTPEAVVIGDFDGDAKLDVATPDLLGDAVIVLLGNGDGTLSPLSFCSTQATQICHSNSDCPASGTCDPHPFPVGAEPAALVAVDLNHDGLLDLVVGNSSGDPENMNGSLTVLKGVGGSAGVFAVVPPMEILSDTFDDPISLTAADLNNDGKPDLVVVNDANDSLSVLLGNGDLSFQSAIALPLSEFSMPEGAVVADFNGDGIPDIASSASLQDKVSVFVGQGNGHFAAPVDFALPRDSGPFGLTAADLDNNGKPDLAVADMTDPGMVSLLLNASGVTLAADIGAGDTSIALSDAAPFPASGTVIIEQEQVTYTGKQGNTLTGVTRGANGTVAAAHAAGAPVTFVGSGPGACVGDCDGSHSVTVDEILTIVNIALGSLPVSDCPPGDANGDQQITVDEILIAVNNALNNGCAP